jgi:hypothetical protein
MSIRTYLEANSPGLAGLLRRARGAVLRLMPPKMIFTIVYRTHVWQDEESRSGCGSNLPATQAIRAGLPRLIESLRIKSILDVPCGDFNWMKEVDLQAVDYVGADIVEELIASNSARFTETKRRFLCLDILQDQIPSADLIFCRDCLVHLSYKHIWAAIGNFKVSGSTYLATTTFPQVNHNADVPTGQHRPINFQLPPFNFTEPITLLDDSSPPPTSVLGALKRVGVWKVTDLPSPG